ncbi:hypothetical protein Emag_001672 [Eimeria magna]
MSLLTFRGSFGGLLPLLLLSLFASVSLSLAVALQLSVPSAAKRSLIVQAASKPQTERLHASLLRQSTTLSSSSSSSSSRGSFGNRALGHAFVAAPAGPRLLQQLTAAASKTAATQKHTVARAAASAADSADAASDNAVEEPLEDVLFPLSPPPTLPAWLAQGGQARSQEALNEAKEIIEKEMWRLFDRHQQQEQQQQQMLSREQVQQLVGFSQDYCDAAKVSGRLTAHECIRKIL